MKKIKYKYMLLSIDFFFPIKIAWLLDLGVIRV